MDVQIHSPYGRGHRSVEHLGRGPGSKGAEAIGEPSERLELSGEREQLDHHKLTSLKAGGLSSASHRSQGDPKFVAKYGPWGVVTGASQGIGAEFARGLAEKGMNVVLVARNFDKLQEAASQLKKDYGVQVKVVAADLSIRDGLEKVKQATEDLEVGMLVNNAGSWQFGSFLDNDIDRDVQSVGLNVEAPMVLSHHFAGKMADRGRGGVVNVGSGAALHGVPGQASYSGTKGFLQNFTESLYRELKPKGVDVLITNPGPVKGEASSVYDQSKVPLQMTEPGKVVQDAFKRLGRGSSTVPGWLNKMAMGAAVRLMPRDMLTSIAGFILESASGKPAEVEASASTPQVAAQNSGDSTKSLARTSEESAKGVVGTALGYLGALGTAALKPVKSALSTKDFAMNFVGSLRRRAEEITENPDKVEAHLKAQGLHHEYQPPVNKTNLKLEGKMTIKANMDEFFELWHSWIDKGYGSINDRQYADVVLNFRDQARELPLLGLVPVVSEDVFSAEIQDGLMTSMTEVTKTKFAGLIPTSTVDWIYQRQDTPKASNSFEQTIDRFDGDLEKVQDFYNDLFDPKKVNPDSKATVTFEVREVEDLESPSSDKEFEHRVKVPFGGLIPKVESTMGRYQEAGTSQTFEL